MRKFDTRKIVFFALLIALTALATATLLIPAGYGYIHLGDAVIYLAAALFGPWAGIIGGLGSALADLMAGYVIYVPATLIIKALMGAIAGKILSSHKNSNAGKFAAFFISGLVMVAGYFAYEAVLYGFGAALAGIPANLLQAAGGIVMGFVLIPIVDRIKGHIKR